MTKLLSYSKLRFICWPAGHYAKARPFFQVNEYLAKRDAAIFWGESHDKIRSHPARAELDSVQFFEAPPPERLESNGVV